MTGGMPVACAVLPGPHAPRTRTFRVQVELTPAAVAYARRKGSRIAIDFVGPAS